MALTPYTRQEEWYQAMINASTGNYLPSITAQDEGKVLTVENDGSWGVENVPQELPAVETTDKDKYLHTNASTGAVEWSAAPTELPSVSGTDEGKVLTVNNSGVWVAENPSSGLPTPTEQDIGKVATAIAIKGNSIASKGNATLTGTSQTSIPTVMEFVNIFVNGATIIASIDGTDAVGTVVEVNPVSNKLEVEIGGYTYKFQRNGGNLKLSKTGSDTKTVNVALYTATVGEGWENPKTSGGVLVVTETDGTLNKTWQEIHDADLAIIKKDDIILYVAQITELPIPVEDKFVLTAYNLGDIDSSADYHTQSASGYPVLSE